MTGKICPYANENGYCDSTVCHNMDVVGNIIPKEPPENISNRSIWVNLQSNWHTGTPTEDGWYLIRTPHDDKPYEIILFKDGKWKDYLDDVLEEVNESYVIAWQKIEPFNEVAV